MPELSITFVAWFFMIASTVALVIGAFLITALMRAEESIRRVLANHAWNEMLLFGIWIMGFIGSWGLLGRNAWGRDMLELFCWVFGALVFLTGITRLRQMREQMRKGVPVNVNAGILGIVLFVVPILLFCWGAIVTLKSDQARQWITGG